MKPSLKLTGISLLVSFLTIALFISCNEKTPNKSATPPAAKTADSGTAANEDLTIGRKNCCTGYTGKLSDPRAEKLVRKCHFIPVELIEEWSNRYKKNKGREMKDKLPDIGTLLGDSSSFNGCIIRKIISNEKCIGLRVVYGMSEDLKIHVMLVGINPDYSPLYIKDDGTCCEPGAQGAAAAPPPPPTGKLGGAEYGQMP